MGYSLHGSKIVIVSADNFDKFRKECRVLREKERRKLVGFTTTDDELARKILEKEKVDIYMPMLFYRKDRQKQRESGLDHVMARLAKKNDVAIGVNLREILTANKKDKAEILARISQNVKLCNKNKLKMVFIDSGEKDALDLKSLGSVLGMPTWMMKDL